MGIRRLYTIQIIWKRELCKVMRGVYERIDDVLWLFSHMERMENDRIAKRVYVGKCAGTRSVGRLRKSWIDSKRLLEEKRFGCQASKENGA